MPRAGRGAHCLSYERPGAPTSGATSRRCAPALVTLRDYAHSSSADGRWLNNSGPLGNITVSITATPCRSREGAHSVGGLIPLPSRRRSGNESRGKKAAYLALADPSMLDLREPAPLRGTASLKIAAALRRTPLRPGSASTRRTARIALGDIKVTRRRILWVIRGGGPTEHVTRAAPARERPALALPKAATGFQHNLATLTRFAREACARLMQTKEALFHFITRAHRRGTRRFVSAATARISGREYETLSGDHLLRRTPAWTIRKRHRNLSARADD